MESIESPLVHVFVGRERFGDWLEACKKADEEGGTISPGGVAARVGCTRQYVHWMLKHGFFRAWVFHEKAGRPAQYIEISAVDVENYIQSGGERVAV